MRVPVCAGSTLIKSTRALKHGRAKEMTLFLLWALVFCFVSEGGNFGRSIDDRTRAQDAERQQ